MEIAHRSAPTPESRPDKLLGAFYTNEHIANFLVWWAVRSSLDSVMDPSFGGGVFIQSACERIRLLGGEPNKSVFGVEVNASERDRVLTKMARSFGLTTENLWKRDFFDVEPLPVNRVAAIVGNPPFIRYQKFSPIIRERALSQAAAHGVKLTQLSSSWAPFVVHSVAMLKLHGRLGLVLPMEFGHAKYALPVLKFITESFGKVTIITFREKLFPHLGEDTLLLLAEEKGSSCGRILHRDLKSGDVLSKFIEETKLPLKGTRSIDAASLIRPSNRLIEHLLPKKARELYQELKTSNLVSSLGSHVDVGIGYVTGANDFFHLSPATAKARDIPREFLRSAVRRGRAFRGLRFTEADWNTAVESGDAACLLSLPDSPELPESVLRYLEVGESLRVPEAYKCRVRTPWYRVPHVKKADAFLTYMSGTFPRLVTNDAEAVAPNTLHLLRVLPKTSYTASQIAALWQTSLTRLSVEIEGHALGGGMLKLEPSEAERCLLAHTGPLNGDFEDLIENLDQSLRTNDQEAARSYADRIVLCDKLGLSLSDRKILDDASRILMNRRYRRAS